MRPIQNRLHSLDIFRGITVFFMILVNNPGSDSVYRQLDHSAWHGCTLADLVFPFFLFIIGVSSVLSLRAKQHAGIDAKTLQRDINKRAATLILLGIALYIFPFFILSRWLHLRVPGVLQRIGLVYFATATLVRCASRKQRAWIAGALLIGYYILMVWVPLPHHEGGVPNLLNDPHATWSAWMDRALFWRHLWVISQFWDPEGLLSTVPAVATGILGSLAGEWLVDSAKTILQKINILIVYGGILLISAFAVEPFMPLNKALWTSSYVLWTAGWASLLLAACVVACDVWQIKKPFWVFYWFGVNPILVYLGSSAVARLIITIIKVRERGSRNLVSLQTAFFDATFKHWISNPELAALTYSLLIVGLWTVILAWLDRKKIYLKV